MSSETWKLEKDLCRCCHSEGDFKNLAEPYATEGKSKMYADILKECLEIDLTPVPGLLCMATYTICDACSIRLRDAVDFKKQVLDCEERFQDMYNRNCFSALTYAVNVDVKEELSGAEDDRVEFVPQIQLTIEDSNSSDLQINDDDDEDYIAEPEGKKRKCKPRKSMKTKQCKKAKRKTETVTLDDDDEEKKQGRVVAPKFRLNDEDYKLNGAIYQCVRCDKTYEKINTLKFHVKSKHYKIPKYKCPICFKEFMTPAPWTIHKLEMHNIDDRFKCRACNKIFNTKVQLRKHINNFHMLGERYKCESCDYESFSFEGMYKHKFKHKTVKDYHCRFCRKSFLRKTTLDLHERIHTGDRRKVCSVCGQAFVQKASLNYHMTKYHPEVNF